MMVEITKKDKLKKVNSPYNQIFLFDDITILLL